MLRLKELRLNRGLSQQNVADFLGVSQQAYANYESGKREPEYESLVKLSEFFDTTTDYLLGKTDIKKAPTDESRDFDAMIDDISASGEDNEGVVMAKGGKGQKRIIIAEDDDEANFAAEAIKLFRKTKRKLNILVK